MAVRLLNVGSAVAMVIVAAGIRRETLRASRMEAERDRLLVAIRETYVPLTQYQDAADARDRLETALREGFLPALQDASVANRESLRLIHLFQREQARLNEIRSEPV